MFQKWLWTYSCPECQSRPIVKFEHFDHAKIWKHTQHDIIYYLIGFVGDYITEGFGQNPKFTLCRLSHVVLMLKTNLIIGYFPLNFSCANKNFAISSDNICFETSIELRLNLFHLFYPSSPNPRRVQGKHDDFRWFLSLGVPFFSNISNQANVFNGEYKIDSRSQIKI